MSTSSAFDWREVPLHGRQLIEASAGTGKTWTIMLLVVRALLETDTRIEDIVVTTYTRAAAQELKVKLRGRLMDAQLWLDESRPRLPQDPQHDLHEGAASARAAPPTATDATFAAYLAARVEAQGLDEVRRRIRAALLSLERAAIDTLHALCARILRDEPLAAPIALEGDAIDARALARAPSTMRTCCLNTASAQWHECSHRCSNARPWPRSSSRAISMPGAPTPLPRYGRSACSRSCVRCSWVKSANLD